MIQIIIALIGGGAAGLYAGYKWGSTVIGKAAQAETAVKAAEADLKKV